MLHCYSSALIIEQARTRQAMYSLDMHTIRFIIFDKCVYPLVYEKHNTRLAFNTYLETILELFKCANIRGIKSHFVPVSTWNDAKYLYKEGPKKYRGSWLVLYIKKICFSFSLGSFEINLTTVKNNASFFWRLVFFCVFLVFLLTPFFGFLFFLFFIFWSAFVFLIFSPPIKENKNENHLPNVIKLLGSVTLARNILWELCRSETFQSVISTTK